MNIGPFVLTDSTQLFSTPILNTATMKKLIVLFAVILSISSSTAQEEPDPRGRHHGTCIIPYTENDSVKYYLTWSSSYDVIFDHDIYNATIFFDANGDLTTLRPDNLYIQEYEAQEPVNATINHQNNQILSVWEDGMDADGPNVRGQLHLVDGTVLRSNWIIAGGYESQHSAATAHLNNKYVVLYADEAPLQPPQ